MPDGGALEGALLLAEVIAANGPLAVTVTKQIARAQADWTVTEGWQRQAELYKQVFESADAREGAATRGRGSCWRADQGKGVHRMAPNSGKKSLVLRI